MPGDVRVVLAPDLPGHWYDNPELLARTAATLGWRGVTVAAADRVTGLEGSGRAVRARVCASHEAGLVGLALRPKGAVGFDLCDPRRTASVHSALPLVLTPEEDALLDSSALAGSAPARLWATVEALAKLAGVGVIEPRGRARLVRLAPPSAVGVSLRTGRFGPLIGCLAVAHDAKEEAA